MDDIDRNAFRRGAKDYQTYARQRETGLAQAFLSLYAPIWRPVEGHEEAYAAGWETARVREAEGRQVARAA